MSKNRQVHGVRSVLQQPSDHPSGTTARVADIGFDPLRIAINDAHGPHGRAARFGADTHGRFAIDPRDSD
jgi:hypothetical protein